MTDQVKERILVVEDEPIIGNQMVRILRNTGRYSVELELDGERAAERIPAENPDLVLLDLGLPGKDGLEVIQEVRERYSGPIVIVTAKSELEVHALGLRTGGSDFLKKPFTADILLAHVECRLRERGQTKGQEGQKVGPKCLEIDLRSRQARLDNQELELSESEFELLKGLASRIGETISRDNLSELLRVDAASDHSRALDMAIHRLRMKLGDAASTLLQTCRNEGYRLSSQIQVKMVGR